MCSEVQAKLSPRIEVALRRDGSASGPLGLPVANVLPEGRSSLNGRLVHLLVLPDVVDRAIAGDRPNLLALGRTGAVAGVFLDVVLDERVGGPAVDGDEDCAGCGAGLSIESDVAAEQLIN